MRLIKHRVNTIQELRKVSPGMGVEVDLRDEGGEIILQHDAFKNGEVFEDYLKFYRHGMMILNIKNEGIEEKVLELVRKYRVADYFFLDLSFPALMRLIRLGERRMAMRFSEYEPLEQALSLKGKVDWLWVDCFSKFPLTQAGYDALQPCFKLCLVSPEIQAHPKETIPEYRKEASHFRLDAVCTKYPDLWQ